MDRLTCPLSMRFVRLGRARALLSQKCDFLTQDWTHISMLANGEFCHEPMGNLQLQAYAWSRSRLRRQSGDALPFYVWSLTWSALCLSGRLRHRNYVRVALPSVSFLKLIEQNLGRWDFPLTVVGCYVDSLGAFCILLLLSAPSPYHMLLTSRAGACFQNFL